MYVQQVVCSVNEGSGPRRGGALGAWALGAWALGAWALGAGALLCWFAAAAMPACAETLRDALAVAAQTNPVLRSQRALQLATGEIAEQARSGWKPVVTTTVSSGYLRAPFDSFDYAAGTAESNDAEGMVTLNQPIYTGGRVANAVRAADARVRAGEQGVRLAEAQTFQSVIVAYMDVLRDQEILEVRRSDLDTLQRQVSETNSRYSLGARITRTDVAQALAQWRGAEASLAGAEAQLDASRSSYRAAVGALPGALAEPDSLPGLPATLDDALDLAAAANPALAQARLNARASEADIGTARSAWMPTVGLQASFGYIGPVAPFRSQSYDREATGLVTLTQPIYSGGLIASQVRAAKDRNQADLEGADSAARQAVQATATAWTQMRAGLTAVRANRAGAEAARTALQGAQLEYGYGLRTTLDVLIADENLRSAQIALAQSRHDTITAEAALLAAIGRLDGRALLAAPGGGTR